MAQNEEAARQAEEEVEETTEEEVSQTGDEQPESAEVETEADEDSEQLKAQLQREKEAREKAEKANADKAFKLREKKRKQEEAVGTEEEPSGDEEDDKPLTAKDLPALLAREREAIRREMQAEKINEIASRLASNESEKELILLTYGNRSFPANLSLEEQLEECFVIANKKKLLGENSELKRALRGKQGVSKDTSTTHHDAPSSGTQPKVPKGEAAVYAQVGFKWNATAKVYEKKLSNGDKLVKDPKTKQTRVVKA